MGRCIFLMPPRVAAGRAVLLAAAVFVAISAHAAPAARQSDERMFRNSSAAAAVADVHAPAVVQAEQLIAALDSAREFDAYEAVLAQNSGDIELRLTYARALNDAGLSERAKQQYALILDQDPRCSRAVQELAGLLLQEYALAEAIAVYEAYVRQAPADLPALLALAQLHAQDNALERAQHYYQAAASLDTKSAAALTGLGNVFFKKKNFIRARFFYDQALAIEPQSAETLYGAGRLFLAEGNAAAAIVSLERSRAVAPEQPHILAVLARAYAQAGKYAQAAAAGEQFLRRAPQKDIPTALVVVRSLIHLERYDAALAALRAVEADTPAHFFERTVLLFFLYGITGQHRLLVDLAARYPVLAAGLFLLPAALAFGVIAVIGSFYALVYALGRSSRPAPGSLIEVRWTLVDAFFLTIAVLVLPLLCGLLLSGLVFGNWFLLFAPPRSLASASVQIAILAQSLSSVLVCGAAVWLVRRKYRHEFAEVGFRRIAMSRLWSEALRAMAAIFFFNLLYGIAFTLFTGQQPEAQLISDLVSRSRGGPGLAPLFFFVVVLGPLAEEVIFRGFIFLGARRYAGFPVAAVASGVIFAAFHLQVSLALPIFFMGCTFALLVERTRSLWPAVVVHMVWNFLSFAALAAAGR
ncbi:MAG: CPBP family glutamic-type intramembrane protease [Candidatus Omnitrophica bacterium]|nr:CPBP family glutamic-type intramembrane protease [Candidatus Omnitrophota bacterium]